MLCWRRTQIDATTNRYAHRVIRSIYDDSWNNHNAVKFAHETNIGLYHAIWNKHIYRGKLNKQPWHMEHLYRGILHKDIPYKGIAMRWIGKTYKPTWIHWHRYVLFGYPRYRYILTSHAYIDSRLHVGLDWQKRSRSGLCSELHAWYRGGGPILGMALYWATPQNRSFAWATLTPLQWTDLMHFLTPSRQ